MVTVKLSSRREFEGSMGKFKDVGLQSMVLESKYCILRKVYFGFCFVLLDEG